MFINNSIRQLLQQAVTKYEAGEYSNSLDLARGRLSSSPNVESVYFCGECLLAKGLVDQAEVIFNEGLNRWPHNPLLLYGMACVCLDKNQPHNINRFAEESIRHLLDHQKSLCQGDVLLLKGLNLFLMERFHEARPFIVEATNHGAEPAAALLLLAKVELRCENIQGANEILQQATKQRVLPDSYAFLAFTYATLGNIQSANRSIEVALRYAPESAQVNLMAHLVACAEGNSEQASYYLGRVGCCEYFPIRETYHSISRSWTSNVLTSAGGGAAGCILPCMLLLIVSLLALL